MKGAGDAVSPAHALRKEISMQKTISVRIVNSGARGQVFPIPGGLLEVRSGRTVERVDILPLDEERIAHYAARGVTIEEARGRKKPARQADMLDSAEADASDAAAKGEAATQAAEADASDAAEGDRAMAGEMLDGAQTA
jgi:hypothetical protein